jgi:hypothetical protein
LNPVSIPLQGNRLGWLNWSLEHSPLRFFGAEAGGTASPEVLY